MGSRVTLDGVETWYDAFGSGEPLVLLHPGGVDSRAFAPNLPVLAERFRVFTPDRRGHGRTPDVDGPISHQLMAADTIAFLEAAVSGPAHLLGYSDGAAVALVTALRRPDLVRRLVFVAGVFHRSGWIPSAVDPDLEVPDFMAAGYGEVSPDGIEHFPVVAAKLARMHAEEPTLTAADLSALTVPTLVMVGDDDEVVLEHAVEMYRSLPTAELAVVPGTSHGLLVEKPDLCHAIITAFLAGDPVPTLAPIRRAPS
jgi:pimeloyl-ACP methyl ester carboxylesterase